MIAEGESASLPLCVARSETAATNVTGAILPPPLPQSSQPLRQGESPTPAENEEWLELPEDFAPSKMDVIVGWARQNYHHEGNKMLRNLVRENVSRYMAARTKHDKGAIIVDILETIRRESPTGVGLVRQNPQTGRWSYIGTDKAKDKIGHALRKSSREIHKLQNHSSSGNPATGAGRRPSMAAACRSSQQWPSTSTGSMSSAQSGGIRGTIDNNTSGKSKLQLYSTSTPPIQQPLPPVASSMHSGRIRHGNLPPPRYPYQHHPTHHHHPLPPHSHMDRQHEYYYHNHHRYPLHPHHPHPNTHHQHYPYPPSGHYDDAHRNHHLNPPGGFQSIHPPPQLHQSSPAEGARAPAPVSSCSTSSLVPPPAVTASNNSSTCKSNNTQSGPSGNSDPGVPIREVSIPVTRPNSVNSNISSKSSGSTTRSSSSISSPPVIQNSNRQSVAYHYPQRDAAHRGYGSYHHHNGRHEPPPPPPPPPPPQHPESHPKQHRHPPWEDPPRYLAGKEPPQPHADDNHHTPFQAGPSGDPSHKQHHNHNEPRPPNPISSSRNEDHRNHHQAAPARPLLSPEGSPLRSRFPYQGPDEDDHGHVSHRIFDEVEEQRRKHEASVTDGSTAYDRGRHHTPLAPEQQQQQQHTSSSYLPPNLPPPTQHHYV